MQVITLFTAGHTDASDVIGLLAVARWLDELYVVPAHRSHGVGRRLLDGAIELATAAGAMAVELEVEISHARGEAR